MGGIAPPAQGTADPADDIPTTAAEEGPTGAHFSEALVFDAGTKVAASGVGYQFGLEWLSAHWTLNNEGDVPMGLPAAVSAATRR